MAGQKGRDVLIRIADGEGGYETLAGIRSTRFQLSSVRVDGTSADSPDAWRELVAGAGVRSAKVSGAGVFKDAASDARMREVFFAGAVPDWELVIPHFGSLTGAFQIAELVWEGSYDGEAGFSVTLESAGALVFLPQGGGT